MRIAIFGTGGAGGYFGAQLARAGEDVVFIARGEHLRAIREKGLRLERRMRIETSARDAAERDAAEPTSGSDDLGEGGFVVHSPATDNPGNVGEVDAVLVGVKAWQVEDASRAMRPMIGRNTVVVPLQNGVDAAAKLASILNVRQGSEGTAADHVLNGLCGTISRVVSPGHILSIGETNFIKFGEFDNRRSERVERLRNAFERANVKAEVPANIEAAVWEKFIFVTPYGGVGALVGVGMTELPGAAVIRSGIETRRMVEMGMEEILAVARARRINLADNIVEKTMALLDSLDPKATTSLQRDIVAGRPSELEAWNGAVVRLGKESGVPTPVNESIYRKLLPLENKARESN